MKKILLIILIGTAAMNVLAQHKTAPPRNNTQKKTTPSRNTTQRKSSYYDETEVSKHMVYADIGITGARILPGISATYNYNFVPWLGLGIGAHAYDFFPTIAHGHQYVPAVYGDVHFIIRPKKRGQVLAFLDIGHDFYKKSDRYVRYEDEIYYVPLKNGTYTGLGLGYLRTLKKRGWGLYTTLKIISNGYPVNKFDIIKQEKYVSRYARGNMALSFGIRF